MSRKSEPSGPADTSFLLQGRIRVVQVLILTAAIASAGGWWAASLVKSPADVAATAKAPPASVLTAPAEMRSVDDALVTRGTVQALSAIQAIPVQAPAGVSRALITRKPPSAGQSFSPGEVVVEISGRPVFFLPGKVPSYRELRPGMVGPDVRQLQLGLAKAGAPVDDPPGRFAASTESALRGIYRGSGYSPAPGGGLPESEVAFVDTPEATVTVSQARTGQLAGDADVELAMGALVVTVDSSAAQSTLLPVGERVHITSEMEGRSIAGTVSRHRSADSGGVEIVIEPDTAIPTGWAGEDVRVDAGQARHAPTLSVPISALYVEADGQTAVVVVQSSGTQRRVDVEAGSSGDGYVAVRALDGQLIPGDRVLVGVA